MSICIAKSRYDTHVMSLSELARRLNLPASRMRKAVADGVIVGSAIVKQIQLNPDTPVAAVRAFTIPLIAATKA